MPCIGLTESAAEFFPEAAWQRCIVHWYRNIFSHVPSTKVREIAAMLKAIHAGEDIGRSAREGHPSDREAAWPSPEPRRGAGGNGGRGDARLLRLPRGALAADSHQQPARAHP